MSVHGVAIRISCRNGRITNPSYKDISATLGFTLLTRVLGALEQRVEVRPERLQHLLFVFRQS